MAVSYDVEKAASPALACAVQSGDIPVSCSDPASTIVHLLSQVRFLHGEVERLEEQLTHSRTQQMQACKAAVARCEEQLAQQAAELRAWRSRSGGAKADSGAAEKPSELLKRCHGLEGQLAAAKAAQGVLQVERSDLLARLRHAQEAIRQREAHSSVVVTHASPSAQTQSAQQMARLMQMVEQLTSERDDLRSRLARVEAGAVVARKDQATVVEERGTVDASTSTIAIEMLSCACQTMTPLAPFLPDDVAPDHGHVAAQVNVYNLSHLLEAKARESDALRARLEEVTVAQTDTLRQLAGWRQRHDEVQERSALLSDDVERLSLQVRSLQQTVSEHAVTERELVGRLGVVEAEKEQLREALLHDGHAHQMHEEQVRQMERDLAQLIATKNYANEQIALLASENERLRAEVQKDVEHRNELHFTLTVKEKEQQEILQAYQNCARENEALSGQIRLAEKELAQARAMMASKEENVLCLQEQLQHLHSREQQLGLDVQSLEYEHTQLSQKLLRCEADVARHEAKANELQQLVAAKDVTLSETRFEMAELSKQLVMKENELMLLRERCETSEHELQHQRAGSDAEQLHARLWTTHHTSSAGSATSEENITALRAQLGAAKEQLRQYHTNVTSLEARLRREDELHESTKRELTSLREELQEALQAKERLQRIVLEQTQTLSQLAR